MRLLRRLLVSLLLVVIAAAVVLAVRPGYTPAIRDPNGQVLPSSIATLRALRLGGVQQTVLLRGADTTTPVLLFLHGGPGMPTMYLAHAFQRPLESDFLVVQWDRRGAGKSYAARVPPESLTVRRTLDDLYELSRWLQLRFHQPRIYLVAHSWGTYLGLVAVREHPEWYRAYVGVGQLVPDTLAAHALQRQLVLQEARRLNDTSMVARLSATGAHVTEPDLFAVGGELRGARSFWPLLRTGLLAPEYNLYDALNVRRGAQLLAATLPGSPGPPLPPAGTHLPVPIFLFLGRYDYNTPSALAQAYLDSLVAPRKGVAWFDRSAHFPFLEEPERFRDEMHRVDSLTQLYWAERDQTR